MTESIRILSYKETIEKLALEERSEGWLAWCEDNQLYQYPVIEWIQIIRNVIKKTGSKKNLEIASGNGIIGDAIKETGVQIVLSDVINNKNFENLDAKRA